MYSRFLSSDGSLESCPEMSEWLTRNCPKLYCSRFLLHECIRVLIQLLTHALMILEIGLQRRMVVYELLVFRQRRIATELLGDFLVFVQELIKAGNLAVIAVTSIMAGVVIRAVAVATVSVVVPPSVVAIKITIASVSVAFVVIE